MYNFVLKRAFFDVFWPFILEQVAVAKAKKNRRNLRKFWLGQLDSNQ